MKVMEKKVSAFFGTDLDHIFTPDLGNASASDRDDKRSPARVAQPTIKSPNAFDSSPSRPTVQVTALNEVPVSMKVQTVFQPNFIESTEEVTKKRVSKQRHTGDFPPNENEPRHLLSVEPVQSSQKRPGAGGISPNLAARDKQRAKSRMLQDSFVLNEEEMVYKNRQNANKSFLGEYDPPPNHDFDVPTCVGRESRLLT
jgi:hypothetical protein